MGRRPEQTSFQRGNGDDKQVHEKILNITNHQGNVNQSHSEIPEHTARIAVIKKVGDKFSKDVVKREPS